MYLTIKRCPIQPAEQRLDRRYRSGRIAQDLCANATRTVQLAQLVVQTLGGGGHLQGNELEILFVEVIVEIAQLLDRFENDFLMADRVDAELFEFVRPDVEQLLAVDLVVGEGIDVVVHGVVETCTRLLIYKKIRRYLFVNQFAKCAEYLFCFRS